MTTTPTPTPENPDRPYSVEEIMCGELPCYRATGPEYRGLSFRKREFADEDCLRLNDAHESAAQAKRDADSVPALREEVARLREALERIAKKRGYSPLDAASRFHECCVIASHALTKSSPTTQQEERKS